MKQAKKRLLALALCLLLLPLDGWAAWAQKQNTEPPRYMRALSRLVAATASEDNFGEIQLTIGEPEIRVDGQTRRIADDGQTAPSIGADGEVQIPAVLFDDIPDTVGTVSPAALEKYGYAVRTDTQSGTITVSEPYGLCRLIVKTASGQVKEAYGATHKIRISDNKTVLQYADKTATAQAAARLQADADVLWVHADRLCTLYDTQPREPVSWGTKRVGADQYLRALSDAPSPAPVVVAVIDSGVETDHPFLAGRLLDSGWDFVQDDADPDDEHNHGTHCAGILCDATPDNVRILPVKVFGTDGKADDALCMEAVRYAVDRGADILSMSWGGTPEEDDTPQQIESWQAMQRETFQYACAQGVTCVAAAGNDSRSLDDGLSLPAGLQEVITISSIGTNDSISGFSNFGSAVDLCAPGEGIVSSVRGGGFSEMSGTSMATPLAAACAALLKGEHPQWTQPQILEELSARAEDLGTPGKDAYYGMGCVSIRAFRPLESLRMLSDTVTMRVFTKRHLPLAFLPADATNQTAFYSSSDASVVSVDAQGDLLARAAGSAIITATAGSGCETAQCLVQVVGAAEFCSAVTDSNATYAVSADGSLLRRTHRESAVPIPDAPWDYVYSGDHTLLAGVRRVWQIQNVWASETQEFLRRSFYWPSDVWIAGTDGSFLALDETGQTAPVQISQAETLTDVVDVTPAVGGGTFFLRTDGTVWNRHNGVMRPVCTQDGNPLRGVTKISYHAAVTASGSVYWIRGDASREYVLAQPYNTGRSVLAATILPIYKNKTFTVQHAVFLFADGTVWGVGSNTFNFLGCPGDADANGALQQIMLDENTPLTGVQDLYYNDFGFFALRRDGTVAAWGATDRDCGSATYLGTGMDVTERGYPLPVVQADGTPLSDVQALIPSHGDRMLFLRRDGSVYISGCTEYYTVGGSYYGKNEYNYAVPFCVGSSPMRMSDPISGAGGNNRPSVQQITLDTTQIEMEIGAYVTLHAAALPQDAMNPFAVFSSADPSVALAAADGTVYGVRAGETTVYARSFDAPQEVYAACTVTVTERTTVRTPGDADGDGAVTLKDAAQILRYLAGGWDAVIDLENADVNRDGEVNLKDAVILRRYLAGGWDIELK